MSRPTASASCGPGIVKYNPACKDREPFWAVRTHSEEEAGWHLGRAGQWGLLWPAQECWRRKLSEQTESACNCNKASGPRGVGLSFDRNVSDRAGSTSRSLLPASHFVYDDLGEVATTAFDQNRSWSLRPFELANRAILSLVPDPLYVAWLNPPSFDLAGQCR